MMRLLRWTMPALSRAATAACLAAFLLISTAPGAAHAQQPAAEGGKLLVYFGTYTQGSKSKGIYRYWFDPASGKLTPAGAPAETENPSFLAIHPNGKLLFAVNELATYEGKKSGAVSSFSIDGKSGALTPINQQPSLGAAPCHLVIDRAGTHVLLANYTGGSVAVLPFDERGRLGKASSFIQHEGMSVLPRQKEPHAHSINLDAGGRFAVVADLGLDKLLVYRYDAERGKLMPNDPPGTAVAPGSGPRHFAFHPAGRFAYVINEIANTVTAFRYGADRGVLETLQTISTLPEGYEGKSYTAEVQVHPSGRFVYGSNRGHNSIAMFRVDEKTGRLTSLGQQSTGGKSPRNFGIDPSGRYLLAANQDSGNVVVFRIGGDSGKLEPAGIEIEVPKPVCVKFLRPAP